METNNQNHKLEYNINIKADEFGGVMDALWAMWKVFESEQTPLSGSCPRSMGRQYDYDVKQIFGKEENKQNL